MGWGGKDGTETSTIDKDALHQVHFLMDKAPIVYSRMVVDKTFDDVAVACRGPLLIVASLTRGRIQGRLCIQDEARLFT